MSTHYFCRDDERRDLARAAGVNGIDYLEVLDNEAPDGAPRQRTLLVYFLAPLTGGIDARSIEVSGGSRITGIQSEWTARATTVDPGVVSPAELAFYGSLGNNVLIIRTNRYGDHSTYTLSIDGLEPPDFDPRLSVAEFSFKAECPHGFDCAPDVECPPEIETQPPIDYLARDYTGFRRLMLDRLSVVLPEWGDRNQVPDVQVALVEAMAYVGDRLSYRQDAVATEAYLDTALQRPSLRRHGRLLDYCLHEGCNARTWVQVDVTGTDAVVLTKGSQFLTQLSTNSPVIPHPDVAAGSPHPYEEAMAQNPTVFEAMESIVAFASHNELNFYTWGDEQCCLQKGATRATLRDDENDRLRLRPGDVILFEQVIDPVTGVAADADPGARHAVRLTKVAPSATPLMSNGLVTDRTPGTLVEDPLPIGGSTQPIVEIEWDDEDAFPFPLCISEEINGTLRNDLAVARGNIILADHGRTITADEAETLEAQDSPHPFRPSLERLDVTYSVRLAPEQPAASASQAQDPMKALPSIHLAEDNGLLWDPVLDLLNSDRFARDFVVEPDNDRRPVLRFGDGIKGRKPDQTSDLTAVYRVGNGLKGNLGRESLAHIVASSEAAHNEIANKVSAIRNPMPAAGAVDPEPARNVALYAPEAFRIQERAVTEADYAEVAERRRDIQKAAGTRRWTGSWHTMFVTLDRHQGLEVDEDFDRELTHYLGKYRLAGQDVEIDGPRFVPLDIELKVCAKSSYFRADVKESLLDVLSCRRRADGRRGFFHPDNFTFGDTLYLSSLVSAAMEVTGVEWVDVTRFQRWQEQPNQELEKARIDFGRLEIPQVENDPNAPENGLLAITMEGGR